MANISPNDLHDAAKRIMLNGKDPKTRHDWLLVVNFWASNVAFSEVDICKVMKLLYQCPLKDEEIQQIAEFQADKKKIQAKRERLQELRKRHDKE